MNSKILYTSAALLMGASFALTSCQNEEFVSMQGQEVLLTVTANRGDVDTRTTFEENGADLICKWSKGDQLIVANASGAKIGAISLVGDGGEATGQFQGLVSLNAGDAINLIYLGNGVEISGVENGVTSFGINYSAQDGTFASMAAHDILGGTATVSAGASDGTVTADVVMARKVDLAYFRLNLDDDVTLAANDVVTITGGDALFTSANVKFANGGSISKAANAASTLTITKAEAGNDIYFTMLPCSSVTPTLTVNKGGYKYTKTLDANNWTGGSYVHAGTASNGTADPYLVSNWDKTALPTDPGDMSNWGGEALYPTDITFSFSKVGDSTYGWVDNKYSIYPDRGYGTGITYTTNAMKNGILTSCTYTDGTNYYEAKYFQWGRWLGFPEFVVYVSVDQLNMTFHNENYAVYPRITDDIINKSYFVTSSSNVSHSTPYYHYSGINKYQEMTTCEMAMNASIVYLCATNDYLTSKLSDKTWAQRSGNPCPTGWRIPTSEELDFFVPYQDDNTTVQKLTSSNPTYARIKETANGKYAVKWTYDSKSRTVIVESVKTSNNMVSVDSSIFDGTNVVTLTTHGYLTTYNSVCTMAEGTIKSVDRNGKKTYNNYIGGYWSSDTKDGYGMALIIEVDRNSTECTIELRKEAKSSGHCIMPIQDSKAVSTSCTPWFPFGSYPY